MKPNLNQDVTVFRPAIDNMSEFLKRAANEMKSHSSPKFASEAEEKITKKYGFYHVDLLLNAKEDKIMINSKNIGIIMENHPHFKNHKISYCEFYGRQFYGSEKNTDGKVAVILNWMIGFFKNNVDKTHLLNAMDYLSEKNKFNSLTKWFQELPQWDGVPRIDNWLITHFGCEDKELNHIIGRKWLISGVARALNPGCNVKGCLVLQGKTNAGKSYALRSICPVEDMFCDTSSDLGDIKKTAEIYSGKFIIEMAELSSLNKSDMSAVKNFLTMQVDTYRKSYGRLPVDEKRMAIYAGTTNDIQFLTDTTGNVRFWCCKVADQIDVPAIQRDKLQLWAEAKHYYLQNASWTLTSEEIDLLEESNEDVCLENEYATYLAAVVPPEVDYISSKDIQKSGTYAMGYKGPIYGKLAAEAMRILGFANKRNGLERGWERIK